MIYLPYTLYHSAGAKRCNAVVRTRWMSNGLKLDGREDLNVIRTRTWLTASLMTALFYFIYTPLL